MRKMKNIFWNFNLLIQHTNAKIYLCIGFVILAMFTFFIKKGNSEHRPPLSMLEYYSISAYFISLFGALFYNVKQWSLRYFSLFFGSIALAIIRTVAFLLVSLIFSTIIKFIGISFFQTSPYGINNFFNPVNNLIFSFPLVQILLFSYQYKNEVK